MIIWVSAGKSSEIQSPFLARGHRYWLHLGDGERGVGEGVCVPLMRQEEERCIASEQCFNQSKAGFIYLIM